jgi:RNA-binding protein
MFRRIGGRGVGFASASIKIGFGDERRPELALTPKQRAHLKSLAHHLKPVVYVGKEGVTEQTVQSIEEALHNRELIKVKVLEAAPLHVREAGAELETRLENANLVQTIGRIAVLYRRHPEKPEIKLP